MRTQLLCFVILLGGIRCFEVRTHTLTAQSDSSLQNSCKKIEKTSKSYNNNCEFRYTACEQSPDEIETVVDCTYCEGQKNCPYLKYLSEVQCIQQCCPFQSFFLASMSSQRLQSCIMFTEMENQANNWVHNQFFFPFLIVLIVLLIITLVFLLVKTLIHIWTVYVKEKKRNQHANELHDDTTTQQNDRYPDWFIEH